ncbi:two component transcriptional regulator, AraC family [Clostridium sp. DL-VIII]|uniref:response regulator transcription factor n=1 Tax=Clostridium sp. DL-VIII TaxID=641107 RepID=UPI00023B0495|nr:response regulator [Clostridium sp. DL-VIII]EHJ01908.1 two component transcriptional regulator, AraC family [Clostridium sp. DL-VIII]
MLKILIVDDEFIERDGILFLINKFSFNFSIKECNDGEEALKYLKENSVDILFTDVKMPFMDGLELSKNAKIIYPNLKIIIFSGFGEFEYAKKAISLGASDYILKPINQIEFKKTMENVIKEVKREKKEKQKREIRSFTEKEHVLLKIISGTSIEDLRERFSLDTHIDFINRYKRMILMEFDNDFFHNHQEFIKEIENNMQIKTDYLNLNPQQSIFFVLDSINEAILKNICMKIHNKILDQYGVDSYFAISNLLTSPGMISEEFSNVEYIMEQRFFISNKYIFSKDLEETLESTDEKFDNTMLKNIEYDIKVKDFYSLRKHVDFLIKKFSAKNVFSQIYVKFILSSIYQNIYKEMRKVSGMDLNRKIDKIYSCRTIQEINDVLNNIINSMEKRFSKEGINDRHEIELVKSYVYENYGKDLSLEILAEYVYMTPSYLSSIFKKETGIGINSFIKNYRMEKAKDMLENTNIKIKAIGNIVGYSNISYFCQSFKEFYGLTPEKHRQRDDANE